MQLHGLNEFEEFASDQWNILSFPNLEHLGFCEV
jgi:hypothetical protein